MEGQNRHCFKGGICKNSNGENLKMCPNERESATYIERSPLLTAETLCLSGLQAVRESRSKPLIVDNYASISYDLDRAIALPQIPVDDFKKHLMTQITVMIHEAKQSPERFDATHLASTMQLNRLAIFMPAFRTRIFETELSPDLMRTVHTGLMGYISDLDTKYMSAFRNDINAKKLISSHKAECETMGLLTRLGDKRFFPYPALAREEAASKIRRRRQNNNHDFYTTNGTDKYPVQVKTSASGSGYKNVVIIKHYDILRGFKRDPTTHLVDWNIDNAHEESEWPKPYRYEQVLSGEAISPLAELLIEEEKQGNSFAKDKRNALHLASLYVISRMQ